MISSTNRAVPPGRLHTGAKIPAGMSLAEFISNQKMKTQHTPGPWFFCRNSANGLEVNVGPSEYAQTVAHVGNAANQGYISGSSEANARLIASAPDLLALLKAIADEAQVFETGPRPYSADSYLPEPLKVQIRALIAKAEGSA